GGGRWGRDENKKEKEKEKEKNEGEEAACQGQARADALPARLDHPEMEDANAFKGVHGTRSCRIQEGRGRRRRHAHNDVVASSAPARVVWDIVVGLRMHIHFHDRHPRCRPSRPKQGLEIDPPPPSSSAHYPTPFIKNATPALRLVPWSTHAVPHVTNA
ncbi:hypothetical protein B0H16DRAFT_1574410, partial [Mycena metata]